MTSVYGYIESYDYKQMYDITDLRGSIPKPTLKPNTLMSIIEDNEDFSWFRYLVKLSGLQAVFDDQQAKFTLFVPSNQFLKQKLPRTVIENMDKYTARQIVLYNSLEREIYMPFLRSTPAMYVNTRIPSSSLLVENLQPGITTLNGSVQIIKGDVTVGNGVIHIVDNLLVPRDMSISNVDY
jgi:uncharacterized surface protein with fasciclin (FAS1) repeats